MFAASSSRGKYWREAFHVFGRTGPSRASGAGAFAVGAAALPHRHLRHAARARLDPADDGRPRHDRARRHHAARASPGCSPRSARPGCCRAASCARRAATTTSSATARLGRTPHRPRDGRARAGGVRRPVAARLDLVRPGARRRWRSSRPASSRAATRVGARGAAPAAPISVAAAARNADRRSRWPTLAHGRACSRGRSGSPRPRTARRTTRSRSPTSTSSTRPSSKTKDAEELEPAHARPAARARLDRHAGEARRGRAREPRARP